MRKPVLAGILFVVAVLAVIIYSTMNLAKYKVEVCMQYEGRTNCRAASGVTRDDTMRSAVTNACATISGGVTGTIQCENSQPTSVRWLREP